MPELQTVVPEIPEEQPSLEISLVSEPAQVVEDLESYPEETITEYITDKSFDEIDMVFQVPQTIQELPEETPLTEEVSLSIQQKPDDAEETMTEDLFTQATEITLESQTTVVEDFTGKETVSENLEAVPDKVEELTVLDDHPQVIETVVDMHVTAVEDVTHLEEEQDLASQNPDEAVERIVTFELTDTDETLPEMVEAPIETVEEVPVEQPVEEIGEAPSFVKNLEDIEVSEGSPVRLECCVVGRPRPTVNWLYDGEPIDETSEFDILNMDDGTCILVIRETFPEDEGEYECRAVNELGTASTRAELYIQGKRYIGSSFHVRAIYLRMTSLF